MNKLPLLCMGLISALAGSAFAQATAGSESGAVLGHGIMSAGGDGITPASNRGYSTLGQPLTGARATSASFTLLSGVSWMVPEVTTSGPILFGVREAAGDADGGVAVDVFGFNLTQPAAGPLAIEVNGALASSTTVVSNLRATAVTPAGESALGNPLAEVSVEATNLLGSHSAAAGYTYIPALVLENACRVAGLLNIRVQTKPGDIYFLAFGKSVTGVGFPIAPWGGQLELILSLNMIQSSIPAPTGAAQFQAKVPNDPVLAGGELQFQAFSITTVSPPDGRFSNLLKVPIFP